jgi:hypothetical protein
MHGDALVSASDSGAASSHRFSMESFRNDQLSWAEEIKLRLERCEFRYVWTQYWTPSSTNDSATEDFSSEEESSATNVTSTTDVGGVQGTLGGSSANATGAVAASSAASPQNTEARMVRTRITLALWESVPALKRAVPRPRACWHESVNDHKLILENMLPSHMCFREPAPYFPGGLFFREQHR